MSSSQQLGGKAGVTLFIVILIAFVAESQLTQYVQTNLHYRQPFFIFFIVHTSFSIIFPLHLCYLSLTTQHSAATYLRGLRLAITTHLSPNSTVFPTSKFIRLVLALTCGITLPGLLWFGAISLASVSDVTAIWNTNAIFAYLITVKLFGLNWEARKLAAVFLASAGVVIVVYGGTTSAPDHALIDSFTDPSAPLLGDLLTLLASFGYGLYQVLYKKYASLPSPPTEEPRYQALVEENDAEVEDGLHRDLAPLHEEAVYPPPFGLHSNLLTCLMGVTTCLLSVFLPVLHKTGIEEFHWPNNAITLFCIIGIALSGVVFNSGLMVLLGIWGPITTSVGNLLTIVLVLISNIIFGNGLDTLTIWSLLGCGTIVFAFGILIYDMLASKS